MFYVLSLGGSIVSLSDGPNISFLLEFKKLIEERVEKGDRFIIVVGGGSVSRQYINSLGDFENISPENKDHVGIQATRLNAFFLKSIFQDLAYRDIIIDPHEKIETDRPLLFSGGYEPGNSTDFVAVLLARTYGSRLVVNLSNIDYVYDKDPKKFPDARKIEKLTWKDFLEIIGSDWTPGMNAPFDPVASLECQKSDKKVVVLNGQNLDNLKEYFSGEDFIGTEIAN
jgi:uridylate kinase